MCPQPRQLSVWFQLLSWGYVRVNCWNCWGWGSWCLMICVPSTNRDLAEPAKPKGWLLALKWGCSGDRPCSIYGSRGRACVQSVIFPEICLSWESHDFGFSNDILGYACHVPHRVASQVTHSAPLMAKLIGVTSASGLIYVSLWWVAHSSWVLFISLLSINNMYIVLTSATFFLCPWWELGTLTCTNNVAVELESSKHCDSFLTQGGKKAPNILLFPLFPGLLAWDQEKSLLRLCCRV